MVNKVEARAFRDEVRKWVGDSPCKATAFGVVCAGIGAFLVWVF